MGSSFRNNSGERTRGRGCRVCIPWAALSAVLLWACLSAAQPPCPEPGTWPTLHRDHQRSGYTPEVVAGPYERKWFRDFHDEMIATRVEAIVAEGKCFVGTFAGRLHALHVEDGSTAWTFQAAGPIGHSPLVHRGRVYVASEGTGFHEGWLYCLAAADGRQIWRYRTAASVWVAPATDGENVYVGDRSGVFHAVRLADGERAWTFRAGGMILKPASVSADGRRIVFGAEDMHIYCLSPSGELLWKSEKLGGLSTRDHAPTIWQDLVIVRTNPARDFHNAFGMSGAPFKQFHQSLEMEADDKVLFDQWGRYTLKWTPRRAAAEQDWMIDYLERNRHEKTFYALRLDDGQEPWTGPVPYFGGLHNPSTPPTFHPATGALYTWVSTSLDSLHAGVPGSGFAVMQLDPDTGRTEQVLIDKDTGLGQPSDETQALSLMGHILLNTHQGSILGVDLNTLRPAHVYRHRDSYGGITGVAVYPTRAPAKGFYTGVYQGQRQGLFTGVANEWHGPDRGIAAVAAGRIFWIAGSQVVCIAGPDKLRMPSGGTGAPGPIALKLQPWLVPTNNVAVGWQGSYDESTLKTVVTVEQIRPFVQQAAKPVPPADSPLRRQLLARLDAAVRELIEGHPWAPLMVQLGISHESPEFWRADHAMTIVAQALPHLPADTRRQAVAWLDEQFEAGVPLTRNTYEIQRGRRREPYDIGPAMTGGHQFAGVYGRTRPGIEGLYALWAYAQYADRWDQVLGRRTAIEQMIDRFLSEPFEFSHPGNRVLPTGDIEVLGGNAPERLNGEIAGLIGGIRILAVLGQHQRLARAYAALAERVTERVHHEKADTCFVRRDDFGAHSARMPRYLSLTPELGAILRQYAGDTMNAHLDALVRQLPVWHHAWGERLVGGENYINPPHLARAMFAALAEGKGAAAEELARYIDQPWCRADLYYIEKLAAALRAPQ